MRRLLVVIDMQNDFIDGALGTKEAEAIVDKVIHKIKTYPADCIYATRDTHGAEYLATAEGRSLPVEHCIRGTKGWEINEDVAEAMPQAVIVDKPNFGSPQLAKMLHSESLKEEIAVELVGLCTDICIVSNALLIKSSLPEAEIGVDASCCAGVTKESHEAALLTMKMCQITVSE